MSKYILLGSVLSFIAFGYVLYELGKQVEKQSNIKESVKALKLKEKNHEKYNTISAYDLCIELGGLQDDCGLLLANPTP